MVNRWEILAFPPPTRLPTRKYLSTTFMTTIRGETVQQCRDAHSERTVVCFGRRFRMNAIRRIVTTISKWTPPYRRVIAAVWPGLRKTVSAVSLRPDLDPTPLTPRNGGYHLEEREVGCRAVLYECCHLELKLGVALGPSLTRSRSRRSWLRASDKDRHAGAIRFRTKMRGIDRVAGW